MLEIGKKAPDFTLPDSEGNSHSLSDYEGQKVVVYFYPKDDTPGCTKEACSFRDFTSRYNENGIKVLGISNDDQESHKRFKEKYNLTHTLLADTENEVCPVYNAYGKKKRGGKEYEGIIRKTYVLDEELKIVKIFNKVQTEIHAEEVLAVYDLN